MKIHSRVKDYHVDVVDRVLENRESVFKDIKANRFFYFVDQKFFKLYQKQLKTFVKDDYCLAIDASESNKEYLKLADYYTALIEAGFKKNDCLVTFGGGILQDISGFIASTLYRGIPWVFFPTTLLAQADSCIGSKTSINFGESKNLIGTFFPPDCIFIDLSFCDSLSVSDFNSGLGEIIKFHILSDPKRFALLKKFLASKDLRKSEYFKDIILSTLEIKKSYFEEDEFDTGRRNLLNYGHSFGHALESASNFAVSHGEAVIVGMGLANLFSLKRGLMSAPIYQEFESILHKYYPRFNLGRIKAEEMIRYLKKDKKRVSQDLTLILGRNIGDFEKYNDVKEEEIKGVYQEFVQKYPKN